MARRSAMNVLLDTCALLALARGELPDGAPAAIQATAGKLRLLEPPLQWFLGLAER